MAKNNIYVDFNNLQAVTDNVTGKIKSIRFKKSGKDATDIATYATDANGNVTGLGGSDGNIVSFVNLGLTYENILFCIGGRNTVTSFTDGSGQLATATVDAGNSGAFSNVGYVSSIAAVNGGVSIANNKFTWNPATESLILGFTLNKTIPVGSEVIMAFSGGVGFSQTGFYLSHRVTTGAIKIVPTIAGVIANAQADSTSVWTGSVDDHCAVTFDATTGVFSIYKNGVLSNTFTGTPMISANAYPSANVANEYRIGGTAGGVSQSTVATKSYGHQAYKFTGGLPLNVGQIIQQIAEVPRLPIVRK